MTPLPIEWTAPPYIRALQTTRQGGFSQGPWEGANLAMHVGDEEQAVAKNRQELDRWGVPPNPLWLNQIHSNKIFVAERPHTLVPPDADGAITALRGQALAILTADCLPILAYSRDTGRLGAFHAGWRGLAGAILEAGVNALGGEPQNQDWWVGPGIGSEAYEVGLTVQQAFLRVLPDHEKDFFQTGEERWQLNLAQAAVRQLAQAGVQRITQAPWTTNKNNDLFWSYRRQNPCGRTAALVWRET